MPRPKKATPPQALPQATLQTPHKRRGRQPGWKKPVTGYEEILSESQQTAFLKGIIDLDPAGRQKIVEHQLPALQKRVQEFCEAVTGIVRSLKMNTRTMAAAG